MGRGPSCLAQTDSERGAHGNEPHLLAPLLHRLLHGHRPLELQATLPRVAEDRVRGAEDRGSEHQALLPAPYGAYDASVLADVYTRGYKYNVMWSTDSLGWKGYTKKQILQRVLDGRKRGAVYLFHVGSQSKDDPALQSIILELRKQGYGFVTINKRLLPPL